MFTIGRKPATSRDEIVWRITFIFLSPPPKKKFKFHPWNCACMNFNDKNIWKNCRGISLSVKLLITKF